MTPAAACICEFRSTCGGDGEIECIGCGGEFCVCAACNGNGSMECYGCEECSGPEPCWGCGLHECECPDPRDERPGSRCGSSCGFCGRCS